MTRTVQHSRVPLQDQAVDVLGNLGRVFALNADTKYVMFFERQLSMAQTDVLRATLRGRQDIIIVIGKETPQVFEVTADGEDLQVRGRVFLIEGE